MDRFQKAAIIMVGIGEKNASEILKKMSPREVRLVLEAINKIDNVTDADVNQALDEFFNENNNKFGINIASKEQVKNSILISNDHIDQ